MTQASITEPMDSAAFSFVRTGFSSTGAPSYYPTGQPWWLYETDVPGVYVVIDFPRMEADGDEDGVWYSPAYDKLLVVSPDELRDATDEEEDTWSDWALEEIRVGYNT